MTTETCSRCGGSGSYSFNLRHGSMCYGCNGSGTVVVTPAQLKARAARQAKATKTNAEREAATANRVALSSRLQPILEARWGDRVRAEGNYRMIGLLGEAARFLKVRDTVEAVAAALGVE